MASKRNLAIWILAGLAALAGVLALVDAARYMGWLPIATLGDLKFVVPSANWLGALLSAIVAGIWFSVAKQLYDLNPQGWLFVVVIAVLNLILLSMALLGRSTWSAVSLGMLVSVAVLVLALLPGTKAAFGQK